MKKHTMTNTMTCKLTQQEVAEKAHRLSEHLVMRAKLISEMKNAAQNFKSKIKSLEEDIYILTEKVWLEREDRLVECEIDYDFKSGRKSYTRLETGEIYKTDAITDSERQMELEAV